MLLFPRASVFYSILVHLHCVAQSHILVCSPVEDPIMFPHCDYCASGHKGSPSQDHLHYRRRHGTLLTSVFRLLKMLKLQPACICHHPNHIKSGPSRSVFAPEKPHKRPCCIPCKKRPHKVDLSLCRQYYSLTLFRRSPRISPPSSLAV
jgi:hypothetical protein